MGFRAGLKRMVRVAVSLGDERIVTAGPADDVLRIRNGQQIADTAGFLRGPDVAVHLGTMKGHDVVGLVVIGASAYLPLALGYDAESDVLTIGETTEARALMTENDDFVGYWQVDEEDPDGFRHPIAVAIRRASVHLAKVVAALPQSPDIGA